MPYLYWTNDKLDWIDYKLKHLARKQYLQLFYLFQMMQQSSLFKIPKNTSFTKKTDWMFILIHQETLGQYYIAFSCTYLDNWLKTIQEWAGNKKTKICIEKDKQVVPD
jgi:biopolymer transport protein ExbD